MLFGKLHRALHQNYIQACKNLYGEDVFYVTSNELIDLQQKYSCALNRLREFLDWNNCKMPKPRISYYHLEK